MHAILLAGGKGTRLQSVSANVPKVLLPIDGVPVIERLIGALGEQGVRQLTVVVGHLADVVEDNLGDGQRLGVKIDYWRETEPLDTAGCLGQFPPPAEPFLLINADIMTDFPFPELVAFHHRLRAMASVAVCRHQVRVDFGVVQCDAHGRMSGYLEKPVYDLWISSGIYCLDPQVSRFVGRGERLSMPNLLLRLQAAGKSVCCYRTDCQWRDIGRPEDYAAANDDLERLRPPGRQAA